MNIAIVSKKGGVGKSQVCLLLYEALRQAKKTVRVHDGNGEQGTISKSLRSIYGGEVIPITGDFDFHIWDTPPTLEHTATSTSVLTANIVLVITSTEPADIWETRDTIQFVAEKNPTAVLRVVFNKVQKGRVLGRHVDEHAKKLSAPTLPVQLTTRECYKHAIAQGWEALDNAAREETFEFALAVLSLRTAPVAAPTTAPKEMHPVELDKDVVQLNEDD
jgi:chromosome partitioning protein